MKYLVDAHLPRRLAIWLHQAGFDVIHTLDLPLGNRTPDTVINDLSVNEQRVVVTKDSDFVDSFVLRQEPQKLLLVSPATFATLNCWRCLRPTWKKSQKASMFLTLSKSTEPV